jgi:D-threo-aldose 1-dehydrogenase
MHHQPFGKTGLSIPPIVFGTSTLGNIFRSVDDQTKREIVAQWFEHVPKPTFIDSAGKYGAGMALEVLGRELQRLQIAPEDVVISNKLGWRQVPLDGDQPTFEPGAWFDLQHDAIQDISYDGILRCWEQGNQLLGEFPARLLSVHDPDDYLAVATNDQEREMRFADILDAYRALNELKLAGKAAGIGVGAKDWRIVERISQHVDLDWIMLANSFTVLRHPPELVEFMKAMSNQGVGIINAALLHGGFLVGGDFFDYRKLSKHNEADFRLLHWRSNFNQLCEHHQVSPYDAAIAYGSQPHFIDAIAVSADAPELIAEQAKIGHIKIPTAFWDELDELQSP